MGDAIVKQGPSDLAMMWRTAEALAGAGNMLPRHLQGNPGAIMAVALTGQELGIGTMAAIRGLYLIRGKVGLSYDIMIGLLRRAGYRIEWLEKSSAKAHLRLTHPDGSTHEETWDVERAKAAKLWGQDGPWSQYPDTMLAARCVSSAARAFAGDVLSGCYSIDEARDMGARVTVEEPDYDPHSYDNPKLARERDEAVEAAKEWRAKAVAELEGNAKDVADVLAQVPDEERHVVADETEKAIHEWVAQTQDERDRVFRHPKASSLQKMIRNRLEKWGDAAGLDGQRVFREAVKAAREASNG